MIAPDTDEVIGLVEADTRMHAKKQNDADILKRPLSG